VCIWLLKVSGGAVLVVHEVNCARWALCWSLSFRAQNTVSISANFKLLNGCHIPRVTQVQLEINALTADDGPHKTNLPSVANNNSCSMPSQEQGLQKRCFTGFWTECCVRRQAARQRQRQRLQPRPLLATLVET